MQNTNGLSSKTISKLLIVAHFILFLLINYFLGNNNGFIGVIFYTLGQSVVVLISFLLLLYNKIKKTGMYVAIVVQILASIGMFCSMFINTIEQYYLLGILCGVFFNSLFVIAMCKLLKHNNSSEKSNTTENSVNFNNQGYTLNNQIQFCRKCGSKIIKDSKFCNKCGSAIDWIRR